MGLEARERRRAFESPACRNVPLVGPLVGLLVGPLVGQPVAPAGGEPRQGGVLP